MSRSPPFSLLLPQEREHLGFATAGVEAEGREEVVAAWIDGVDPLRLRRRPGWEASGPSLTTAAAREQDLEGASVPANLSPEYKIAQDAFRRASDPEDKLACLDDDAPPPRLVCPPVRS